MLAMCVRSTFAVPLTSAPMSPIPKDDECNEHYPGLFSPISLQVAVINIVLCVVTWRAIKAKSMLYSFWNSVRYFNNGAAHPENCSALPDEEFF